MRQKRFIWWIFLLILSALFSVPHSLSAQDSDVRVIPLSGHFLCGDIAPDGQTVVLSESAVAQMDAVIPDLLPIQLIDVESGNVTLLQGPSDYAYYAAFTPDGNTLATYHANGYIYLWQVGKETIFDTGANTQPIKQIPALPGSSNIEFMPDGRTLVNRITGMM
ncbi:MAG TPA: WD40 repeat domain-containing protein, partial [Aggregatilineaceae bacterium]|nr:WD40 repeat domain-containing protein [Aggregatilineaceae bacterium]